MQPRNIKDSAIAIQFGSLQIENLAHKNRIIVDPDKFEAIHFSQKYHFSYPKIVLPTTSFSVSTKEPWTIKPIKKK